MGQHRVGEEKEVGLQDIQELYRKLQVMSSGNLHVHEFKRIFGLTADGKIDFLEYVAAIHLVLRGKLEDKLRWSFKVYDRDGNGCLDKQEVRHIVKIIHKIKKKSDMSVTEKIEDVCDRIFELVDKNKDSQISLEEFIEGAEKDPWLMNQLRLDIGPCEWFIEQREKKL
uniref:EF-hand domain-containing protein n=1 Tax=Takifugu rubripes TaxID=31033 RepID=A0A3B5K201_TAKRU